MSSIRGVLLCALVAMFSIWGADVAQAQTHSWGLDRIDQPHMPMDGVYNSTCSGAGISVYILGTGMRDTHIEFVGGRGNNLSGTPDKFGLGTYWASLVAGEDYGVANGAQVYGYDVLTGFKIDWDKVADALIDVFQNGSRPAVVLIPWAVPEAQVPAAVKWLLQTMVNGCDSAGFGVVVAAGNNNADACDYWPANVPEALTVAASDSMDTRTSFSNADYLPGQCVDLFAPGKILRGAWSTNNIATKVRSGTGAASSLAAGALAKTLACFTADPFDMDTAIADLVNAATPWQVSDAKDSPNKLLYSK